jgi:DNA invertase Pin-like site-specific DNA recombinase
MGDIRDEIRKRHGRDVADDLYIVPRNEIYEVKSLDERDMRVAGYARVSTLANEQEISLVLQEQNFQDMIKRHPNWTDAGIYTDEGISGTSRDRREAFNRMMEDCKAGKINMIITKSISRFARNAADCLSVVQMLNQLQPKVGVMFEVEGINTFNSNSEMVLTVLAAYAQEESHIRNESMLWSVQGRFKRKNFLCPTNNLLGYETEGHEMVIEPEGARTVQLVFAMYLAGCSTTQIAVQLTRLGRPTGKGNYLWSSSSVCGILRNERYCGDVVGQKSHTLSYLTHKSVKNERQMELYYDDSGHHEGIVSREVIPSGFTQNGLRARRGPIL